MGRATGALRLASAPLNYSTQMPPHAPQQDDPLRQMKLHLAMNVIRLRQDRRLTQLQLANVADLSRATVHLVEAGACDARMSTITSIAAALGVDPVELLGPPDGDQSHAGSAT